MNIQTVRHLVRFLTVAVPLSLCGQTKPALAQIGAPVGASACSLVVFVASKGYLPATLDASLICDTSGPLPVIRAAVTQAASRPVDVRNEVHLAAGNQIPFAHSFIAGTQCVWRNGVRMAPGIDYDVGFGVDGTASAVVFRAGQALMAGDVILVDYQMPAAAVAAAVL